MDWKPGTRLVKDEEIMSMFGPHVTGTTKGLAGRFGITEMHMRRRLKRLLRQGKLSYTVVENDSGRGRKKWLWSLSDAGFRDEKVPDEEWWFDKWAEFEDFVGIGKERVERLAPKLRSRGVHEYNINRLLKANGLPHGPTNASEAVERGDVR